MLLRRNGSRLCVECESGLFADAGRCRPCSGLSGPVSFSMVFVFLVVNTAMSAWLFLKPLSRKGGADVTFAEVTGAETLHLYRQAFRVLRLLWREAALFVVQVPLVLTLALVGLAGAAELVVLVLGCVALVCYLAARRLSGSSRVLSDAHALENFLPLRAEAPPSVYSVPATATAHMQDLIKGGLIYAQCVSSVAAASGGQLSGAARGIMSAFSRFTLQVSGLECAGLSIVQRYVLVSMIPLLLATITLITFGVLRAVLRHRLSKRLLGDPELAALHGAQHGRELWLLRQRALQLLAVMFYFFAFPLLQLSLSAFAWDTAEGSQVTWMRSAPWVTVSLDHGPFRAILIASVITLCALSGVSAVLVARVAARAREVRFLYSEYLPHAWWYEGAITTRRVVVALVASVLPVGSPLLAPLIALAASAALFFHTTVGAFKTPVANFAETASLVALSFSSYLVSSIAARQQSQANSGSTLVLELLLLSTNLAIAAAYLVGLGWPALRILRAFGKHDLLH
eukprot:Amastigsp_a844334_5.p1 type:complete len:514 gc:universal Amastigsp_a844334_5:1659-118(-)